MNNYRISVSNIVSEVASANDYTALRDTGLFGKIVQINYAVTTDGKDLWIYRVELNGKFELATVERV